jgi:hypothetical protein
MCPPLFCVLPKRYTNVMNLKPIKVQIITSDEKPYSEISSNTKLCFEELIKYIRITHIRLIKEGYSIIGNKVIDPKGKVIYENYKH